MSIFIGEQAFSRLQIREKMSMADGTRTTNLVMACNLMFLYSQYRLIGIAHQQATKPMTEQEANERASFFIEHFTAEEIARLLKREDLSITDVAYQLDFNTTNYFTRYVKRVLGMTPSQYKAKFSVKK